jgi:hypothetical protein
MVLLLGSCGWKFGIYSGCNGNPLKVFFFFFSVLGFELRAYTLSHSTRPFFVMGFFEIGSSELLPGLALNCDPPDLCLLSS